MSLINSTVCILVSLFIVGIASLFQRKIQVVKQPSITLEDVIHSCHDFTSPLYRNLSESTNDSILISPVNLYVLLSLFTYIAADSTRDELKSILYHNDINYLIEGSKVFVAVLKDSNKYGDLYTRTMYADYRCPFKKKLYLSSYDLFDLFATTFLTTSKIETYKEGLKVISSWARTRTNKTMGNTFCADSIEKETRMMLLDTVYFKGNWLDKFDEKHTHMRPFHVSKTDINLVPTMIKKTKFNCGEIPEWKASFIEIPYENSDFVMVILLPYEEVKLQTVENNFDWKLLANAPRSVEQIELYLPKFKFDFTIDLQDILKKMNVIKMFSEYANYPTMSQQPIRLGHIIQKVFIEVDEGTKTANATTVAQGRSIRSTPRMFAVERPFLFAIEYKPYKLPLLLGNVRKIGYSQSWKNEL